MDLVLEDSLLPLGRESQLPKERLGESSQIKQSCSDPRQTDVESNWKNGTILPRGKAPFSAAKLHGTFNGNTRTRLEAGKWTERGICTAPKCTLRCAPQSIHVCKDSALQRCSDQPVPVTQQQVSLGCGSTT